MKNIKELLKSFEGKKRNIGIIAVWVLRVATSAFPQLLPLDQQMLIRDGIDIFLLGSTLDAFRRTDKGQEIINKALKIK